MDVLNGITPHLDEKRGVEKREPEMVSAQTLAQMWDIKIRTIRDWVNEARTGTTVDGIPFKRIPGSRLIRFPLKEVRAWRDRANNRMA